MSAPTPEQGPWPQQPPPGPGQGSSQQPPPTVPRPAGTPMTPAQERNWATGAHLSGFLAAYVALGFLGPLVVMLVAGDRSPYVRRHAVEALNFNLTWLLYIAVSAVLMLVLVGFVLLAALGIAYLVLVIMAAVAANEGREFRYPLTIRLIR